MLFSAKVRLNAAAARFVVGAQRKEVIFACAGRRGLIFNDAARGVNPLVMCAW